MTWQVLNASASHRDRRFAKPGRAQAKAARLTTRLRRKTMALNTGPAPDEAAAAGNAARRNKLLEIRDAPKKTPCGVATFLGVASTHEVFPSPPGRLIVPGASPTQP